MNFRYIVFTLLNLTVIYSEGTHCPKNAIVIYKVIFETFWTEENFPKNYPLYRPPAQWSQLFGQSHNESYSLYRVGEKSSEGLQNLAEKGDLELLNVEGYQDARIFDQFTADAIKTGAGSAEAEFFVGTNHSKVSVAARLIPSPDWFVGVSSFELCRRGVWVDAVSVSGNPLDAGTDEGLAFTSPNWRTEPRGVVITVTSRFPSHPAGSFYYPEMEKLPAIANFRFVKVKEFSTTHTSAAADKASLSPIKKKGNFFINKGGEQASSQNDVETPQNDQNIAAEAEERKTSVKESTIVTKTNIPKISKHHTYEILFDLAKSQGLNGRRHFPRHFRSRLLRAQIDRENVDADCLVSEWSDWSPCSQSCGFGEKTRQREVTRLPLQGGRPCPSTTEREFCGSATLCRKTTYFNW